MGLVRAWRRQIYGASLVAILIPASIIVVLFALTGGGPLHGLGTLGQVFSGPAIPGGNLSARVSLSSKPALPGKGTVGAAALRGHSPLIGQPSRTPSSGSHGPAVAPVKVGTTAPSTPGAPSAPSNGGQLHGGSSVGASGTGGNPPPRPPANTPTTTTTSSTTTTDSTTAASLPPIVAVPPPPVTSTSTTTPTTATTTTTTTTPVHTTTTTRTTTTTTSTTKTTTTSTTKTTTTPTTKTTTTPTTRTTTTTVTHTTTTIRPPTSKTATTPLDNAAPALATTVAQAERGSATFTGCSGNWGVGRSGHVEQIAPAASLHAASNGGTSTID